MFVFYPDVYFATQLIGNLFVLNTICAIIDYSPGRKQIGVIAATSALIETVLLIIIKPYIAYIIVVHIFLIPACVLVTFGRKRILELRKEWLLCYGVTILYYGILQWLYNETGYQGVLPSALCAVVLYYIIRYVEKRCRKSPKYYKAVLVYGDREVRGTGLYDSGNLLRDPIYGRAVSVASKGLLQPILEIYDRPYMPVVYQTISSKSVMDCIVVNELKIYTTKGVQTFKNAQIGIAPGDVLKKSSYQLLIHKEHTRIRRGDCNAYESRTAKTDYLEVDSRYSENSVRK